MLNSNLVRHKDLGYPKIICGSCFVVSNFLNTYANMFSHDSFIRRLYESCYKGTVERFSQHTPIVGHNYDTIV